MSVCLEKPPTQTFATFGTMGLPQLGLKAATCAYDSKAFTDDDFAQHGIAFDPSLRRAVRTRKAEFLAGRLCASRALARIGVHGVVGMEQDRCPSWPDGTVGSISHCADQAIAVALPAASGRGVGIDMECRKTFAAANLDQDRFMTDAERAVLRATALPEADYAILAFSIKESFFKCAYPQVRRYFDFFAVAISEIDTRRQKIILDVKTDLCPEFLTGRKVTGGYKSISPDLIVTATRLRTPLYTI